MKRLLLFALWIAAALALPSAARAVTIDVISQSYSIDGAIGYAWDPQVPFSFSGSTPVSFGGMGVDGGVNPSADALSASAHISDSTYGTGSAVITWKPSENCLADIAASLFLADAAQAGASWELKDLTTSATIFSARPFPLGTPEDNVPLDATHIYQLTAGVYGSGADYADVFGSVTVHSGPDAASTSLLLGLALAGLAVVRRTGLLPS
jgi:hypothetical protein